MRVLALTRYGRSGASSRMRFLQYIPALREAGIDVAVSPLLGDGYVEALYAGRRAAGSVVRGYLRRMQMLREVRNYDVVWVEKECLPWLPALLELGLLSGHTPLVADYDDAWFHRYDAHTSGFVRKVLGKKIAKVMNHVAIVTAGNQYLAGYARRAGARRVEELPTVVDLRRYPRATCRTMGRDVVIGWIGSPSTAHYLQMLSAPLEALAQRHPIRCVSVGARTDQVQGTCFEAVSWSEETEVDSICEFDIGVMPLVDEPFERGKCGYKLIQYMACGLPVVASPVGVNSEIVQPGVNGELARTNKDWEHALDHLICDAALRHRLGESGRQCVEAWYSLQVQAPQLIGLFRSLTKGESPECAA